MSNQITSEVLKDGEARIRIPDFLFNTLKDIPSLESAIKYSADILQFYVSESNAGDQRIRYWNPLFAIYTHSTLCDLFFTIYKTRVQYPEQRTFIFNSWESYCLRVESKDDCAAPHMFERYISHLRDREDVQKFAIPLLGALVEITNSCEA